tara:strand:+ start:411 stop:635 length:225 start_codon:yes stop_codon:yes gene_type:complete
LCYNSRVVSKHVWHVQKQVSLEAFLLSQILKRLVKGVEGTQNTQQPLEMVRKRGAGVRVNETRNPIGNGNVVRC